MAGLAAVVVVGGKGAEPAVAVMGAGAGIEPSNGTVCPTATVMVFPSRWTSIFEGVILVTVAPAIESFTESTLL